jgi:hypothetical protein
MTVVLVPRPADALQPVFERPLDLSQTFYGPDPLLGVWTLECERAVAAGERIGRVIVSLVGVPDGLTSSGALPVANNFAHALIRVDTSSRLLVAELRRSGLPASLSRRARYRHSPAGEVPFRGSLLVPKRYRIAVSATALDPTNPHDHLNRFEHRARDGRTAGLRLSTPDAIDRFCFPESGGCEASARAPRGSAFARLLGGTSAPVRAGFDHERLKRVVLLIDRPGR